MSNATETPAVTPNTPPASALDAAHAYQNWIQELSNERDTLKEEIKVKSARLQEVNAALDKEKENAKALVSMMVQSRKKRESKAPTNAVDSNGNAIPPKKRGRPKKSEQATS